MKSVNGGGGIEEEEEEEREEEEEKKEEEEDSTLQSIYIHPNFAALIGSVTANRNLFQRIQFFWDATQCH